MHVIIQAGGKGTRLESLTRNKPKCLVPVKNKPLIFWALEAFKDYKVHVICDYQKEPLKKYLGVYATEFDITITDADGKGTISGIRKVLDQYVPEAEPVLIVWCDLLFEKDFELPLFVLEYSQKFNWVGLSSSFPCRWSFINGEFVHQASSSQGVAGVFLLKNKEELEDLPREGAFVPWVQSKKIQFKEFYLENVVEVGTLSAFTAQNGSICRPFNEVIFNKETVTKRAVTEYGKNISNFEIDWYKKVKELGFDKVPKIFSYQPLVMERIQGKNIWEFNCLTKSEKIEILHLIISTIKQLHDLGGEVPANLNDLEETYITKTFSRLGKIEELVPFAKEEYIKINGKYYKNIFYDKAALKSTLSDFYPSSFRLIHGDVTFSNMLYDRVKRNLFLIDPRGYFGKTKFYGDPDYDWAKLYYSIVGNYDQFNRKNFALDIQTRGVEIEILSNNWSDMENYFFDSLPGVSRRKIKALHAVIWLSLTTYAWEDYDSICGAFYKGIVESSDFL